jgi:hypothetical protein
VVVNGEKVQGAFLNDGDIVVVSAKKPPFVVRKKTAKLDERINALLISAHDNDDLKASENNVYTVKGMLLDKGAKEENIVTLFQEHARRNHVRDSLERMIDESHDDSLNFVYISTHGMKRGKLKLFGHDAYHSKDFYRYFNWVSGKKVLVIEACYAASFTKGMDKHTLFFASSLRNMKSWSTEHDINLNLFTRFFLEQMNAMDGLQFEKVNSAEINRKLAGIKYPSNEPKQRCYKRMPKAQRSSLKGA